MTIKHEILEDLRKRMSIAEIRRKYRSVGSVYEVLREFLPELEKEVEKTRTKLGKAETKLAKTEDELERASREKEKTSGKIEELTQTKEKLKKEVTHARAELDLLKTEIWELLAKGFTPDIMNKIATIESRSGPDLLSQIGTVAEHKKIRKEVYKLEELKALLEEAVQNLNAKREKLEKRLRSERNKLDELILRITTIREAVDVVFSLIRDGYSTADIKSLKYGLNKLGIEGEPLLSVKRLLDGLLKYKSLVALEDKMRTCRKELQELKKAVRDARSKLRVVSQLIKAFEEVRDAGVEAIADTVEQAKTKIADVAGVSEKYMTASAGKFDVYVQRTMEEVRTGLGEWRELQEQKGRLKEVIHPALVLLGILKSPEYLRQLPLTFVFQLFDRLHCWSEMNLKDVSIRPSQDLWRKDANLNPLCSFRLPVLIEFVCEGLREIMTQRDRET